MAKKRGENEGDYQVQDPRVLYRGKGYGEWCSDWFNWFISANADKRNSGPVVHLRSLGIPKSTEEERSEMDDGSGSNTIGVAQRNPRYVNRPNIRVGGDGLQIFEDQAVLCPIIISYWVASEPYVDWGYMQDYTGTTLDNGDNPPTDKQLTINGQPIVFPAGLKMKDFRILSSVFTAVIPESGYGISVKDFLEMPASPGQYAALVEGYFVMLKFKPGTYYIHSWASAPREAPGPYYSELLYQIDVLEERPPRGSLTKFHPLQFEAIMSSILFEKAKTGELTEAMINYIKNIKPIF